MQNTKERPEVLKTKPRAVGVRFVDGRVVSATLNDPEVKKEVKTAMAVHRRSKAALLQFYVDEGVLTADGHLTKSYGGA